MFPAPFRVVLDANVLFPFSLRDTLLRAAERGLFQLYWTQEILAEALAAQAAALRNPALSLDELVAGLAKLVPDFVELVNAYRR